MPVLASQCPATCMHLSASAELGAEHSVLSAMKCQPDGKHFNANAGQLESTEVQVLPSARGPNDPHSAPPPRVNLVRTKSGHCGVLSLVSSAASAPGNGKAKLQVKEVTSLELVLAESTKYQTISEGIQPTGSERLHGARHLQSGPVRITPLLLRRAPLPPRSQRPCHDTRSAAATTLALPPLCAAAIAHSCVGTLSGLHVYTAPSHRSHCCAPSALAHTAVHR